MVYNDSTNMNAVSEYIVDSTGRTPYTTIQSALNAANAAGGGIIYVRPAIYTENLTLYDKTEIVGTVGEPDGGVIKIIGIHIPPSSGYFAFRNLILESATDIFNSAAAGTAILWINECVINVTNGYTFNLPNWTGTLKVNNCGAFGVNDGFINNTAGATIFTNNSQLGAGTGNTYIANGTIRHDLTFIVCPANLTGSGNNVGILLLFGNPTTLGGSATWTINSGSQILDTLTITGTTTIEISNSIFNTGSNIPLTQNSSNPITLTDVTIDSTAFPYVITGSGTIKFGSVTFPNNSSIAGTITQDLTSIFKTGEVHSENLQQMKNSGFISWGGSGNYYSITGSSDFNLLRPGTGYIESKLISWSGAQSISSLPAGNTHYIYIDNTGTIGSTITRTAGLFENNIILFEVLVDSSGVPNVITVKENHPYNFTTTPSNWAHDTVGTVLDSITNGANIVLNGTKSIQINGQDVLTDHGLNTTIPDSGGSPVTFNFMYTNASGKWIKNISSTDFPSSWNNGGTITALGANKWGVFRLYVSKDDLNSTSPTYYAIYDTSEYNSKALAQTAIANNAIALATNEFFELEMAQLGFIIKQQSTDTIDEVIIQKSTVRPAVTVAVPNQASLITTNTTNFDSWLSAADSNVQAALETLDDIGKGIITDPGTSGDSYLQFNINTTNEFRIGVDDDAGDAFKISQGGALGTNDTFVISSAGEITKPLNPAFSAYLSSTVSNVTGDNTEYTIICDTENFDQNSDYNNTTGIFTAPITGKYLFIATIHVENVLTSFNSMVSRIRTTTRRYDFEIGNPGVMKNNSDLYAFTISGMADMSSTNTAYLTITISGGPKSAGIRGGTGAIIRTNFQGYLIG